MVGCPRLRSTWKGKNGLMYYEVVIRGPWLSSFGYMKASRALSKGEASIATSYRSSSVMNLVNPELDLGGAT